MADKQNKQLLNLHKDHRSRMKTRFLQHGLAPFADHEILEVLLYYAIPQKDTNPLAHQLLHRFGTLPGVFSASQEELCKVPGIGEHAAVLLQLILPVASRVLQQKGAKNKTIGSFQTTDDLGHFFVRHMLSESNETVYMLMLDNARNGIACERVCDGSVNAVSLTPRMLLETAVAYNASFVVIAHNHPGGIAVPSQEDLMTTANIRNAFSSMGIPLLEHILVAGSDFVPILEYTRTPGKKPTKGTGLHAADAEGDYDWFL